MRHRDRVRTARDEYWVVGVTVTTIFETAWALRGYERMLMDFALDPEVVERILDIPFRYHLAAARRLVELDVLNPVQPRSMDPAALKREFGDRLCLWGSIDEQHTLPFGTLPTSGTRSSPASARSAKGVG